MTSRSFIRALAGPIGAALVAAVVGCGGGGTSAEDALDELRGFDKAAVASHNSVSPKFERTTDCASDKTYVTARQCAPAAKAYVAALRREQRKLESAYTEAPDYVQRIYGDYYKWHRKANDADLRYADAALDFIESSKTLDVADGQRAVATMERVAEEVTRLDTRTQKLLQKARDASDEYVRSL